MKNKTFSTKSEYRSDTVQGNPKRPGKSLQQIKQDKNPNAREKEYKTHNENKPKRRIK